MSEMFEVVRREFIYVSHYFMVHCGRLPDTGRWAWLSALWIVLGVKKFILYIAFVMVFSLATELIVNLTV